MLPHHEDERQRRINIVCYSILDNQDIARIFELITELLTIFIGKNTKCTRKNTDAKIIDIANCKTSKKRLLDVEYVILIKYYYQTAKTRVLYESTDRSTTQPANNPPNSDRVGDVHWTIPKSTVLVYWEPGLSIGKRFSFITDLDPKWLFGTVTNTTIEYNSALTRLHKQVALTRLLSQGRSHKVALTRSISQGRSHKVALTRLLSHGRSHKVALTWSLRLVVVTGCSEKYIVLI